MSDTILRKCGGCSDTIEINRNNILDVLYYKNKYYHSKCFCEIAEKRSKAKRSTASEWQGALDNLWELEAETKKMLESAWIKDDLNDWLLSNYDITVGQSNMAGRGYMVEGDQDIIDENVFILNDAGEVVPATNPLNQYSSIRKDMSMQRINPGFSFSKKIAKKTGRKVLLVVNARGGTAIKQWKKR